MITLRAEWVIPIDAEPIKHGEVVIDRGRIVEVRQSASVGLAVDFGNSAILPGLVNTHTHLELTPLRGLVSDLPFFPWIRRLTEIKRKVPADAWLDFAELGALQMISGGVTAVADCGDSGASVQALVNQGLRGIVYPEVFGLEEPLDSKAITDELITRIKTYTAQINDKVALGYSPHSVYTVRPPLLSELNKQSGNLPRRKAIHCAETCDETDFMLNKQGQFAEMYRQRNIPMEHQSHSSVAHLKQFNMLSPETLLIHCVQVTAEDIQIIKMSGSAAAHCPCSNSELGVGIAPVWEMLSAGIPMGLGTDGTVSNPRCDMFEEMRWAVRLHRLKTKQMDGLNAKSALRMATLGGAEALGLGDEMGSLTAGKSADLCVVSLDKPHIKPYGDVVSAIVGSACASDVVFTMVAGEPLYEYGNWYRSEWDSRCGAVEKILNNLSL